MHVARPPDACSTLQHVAHGAVRMLARRPAREVLRLLLLLQFEDPLDQLIIVQAVQRLNLVLDPGA